MSSYLKSLKRASRRSKETFISRRFKGTSSAVSVRSFDFFLKYNLIFASSMKFVALISGGKDSVFNIIKCLQNGHELVALINLYPNRTIVKFYF